MFDADPSIKENGVLAPVGHYPMLSSRLLLNFNTFTEGLAGKYWYFLGSSD